MTLDQTARLSSARDEALRRYTQHLTAVQLKNSRWHAVLVSRPHGLALPPARPPQPPPSTNITHAH
jgi:hypothetical protein